MHEAAMMRGVAQEALTQMRAAGGTRIIRVVLALGSSGHMTKEAARQHFTANTQGTPAEGAALEIKWLPATYRCVACPRTFTSSQPYRVVECPVCGSVALEMGHADVCYISEIEIDVSSSIDSG